MIEDGLTGFVVEDETSAVGAIRQLSRLSRTVIRKRFEEQFTARRMAEQYLRLYRISSLSNRAALHSTFALGRVSGIASHTITNPALAMPAMVAKAA